MSDASRTVADENAVIKVKPAEFKIEHLLYLESVMPLGRAEEFRKCEKDGWKGCEAAKELFDIWKKLRQRCKVEEQKEPLTPEDIINENQVTGTHNENNQTAPAKNDSENQEIGHDAGEERMGIEVEDKTKKDLSIENTNTTLSEIFLQPSTSTSRSTPLQEKVPEASIPKVVGKISTSFIDHIFWPTESPEKKNNTRRRERLPYAATSKRWLQYHEEKENVKKEQEEVKKKRAEERKRKQEEKDTTLAKKMKTKVRQKVEESDSDITEEWVESGSSLDDISDEFNNSDFEDQPNLSCFKTKDIKVKGDFYVVAFPGKNRLCNYVCVIQNVFQNNEYEVLALNSCNEENTIFKVIENDISVVGENQFIRKLQMPELIAVGDRYRYRFLAPIKDV